jgi:probable rRNA maturation factor
VDSEPPDTPPDVIVTLSDEQDLEVDLNRIAEVARRAAESELASGEISITLATTERMAALNAEYMGRSGPTDVLSFPIDGPNEHGPPGEGPPRMIGELVLCPEVAARQAPSGLATELDLLTAHGVLHLLGYDHDTEAGAEQMRKREHDLTGRSGARAS